MYTFWLIFGIVVILVGILNRRILRLLDIKPMSEILTTPNLKRSTQMIEQIGRWLVITLGVSFFIQGVGGMLPSDLSHKISFSLLTLAAVLFLTIVGITIVNWKAK